MNFKIDHLLQSCDVRILKDDILLAQYNASIVHMVPKWLQPKPTEESTNEKRSSTKKKIIYLIVPMVLAIIIWGLIYSWTIGLILFAVLLIHEFGHLAAMTAFGYKNKKIIFIPPLGATAIGTKDVVPDWQKIHSLSFWTITRDYFSSYLAVLY